MSLLNKASLIQIPSGYKDGTLYSAKPTNGDGDFTFSRGSNLAATRINSEGLIEKGRENLLLQSNTFDTTWSSVNVSLTSGQSGYDGSSDAWLFTKTPSQFASMRQTISKSGVYTYSVYAKAGTLDYLIVYASSAVSPKAWFNLATGAVGTTQGGLIDSSITDVGNGWYRCTIVFSDTITDVRIYPNDTDGTFGSTAGNILIQDAQLEIGLAATDVITTTTTTEQAGILEDMPRLDYSGGATCPSLVLEPQRSNKLPQSEYFGAWNPNNATLTANAYTSPEGYDNAYKMVTDGINAGYIQSEGAIVVYSGTTYAFSMYFNTNSTMTGDMVMYVGWTGATGSNRSGITFTIETGAFVSNYTSGSGAVIDYDITTPDANGWYRVSFWANSTNTATGAELVVQDLNLLGDGSKYLLIYGGQMEEGSYPTSYIPTYGSSVTRSEYSCSKTGISDILNNSEGTLFLEVQGLFNGVDSRRFTISDGTTDNRVAIELDEIASRIRSYVVGGGANDGNLDIDGVDQTQNLKIGVTYNGSVLKMSVNGSTPSSLATSVVLSGMNTMQFSTAGASTNKMFGKVKQALIFKTALTDAELAALTTI